MHDPVLDEALKRLAAEASTRFSSLVATGDSIPFDVAENDGESSHFYRYVPLTSRYITAHLEELKSLPSYGPARGAVASSEVAAPYLEQRGLPVPSEPNRRAEEMLAVFITSLWEGSTEFSLDISRVEKALAEVEIEARDVHEADVLLAPLVGFEMTPTGIDLAGEIRIVQGDSINAPLEATSSEGTERSAWEQAYLAMVPLGEGEDGPRNAVAKLHGLVRALRLFKEGSVGLGPFAFAPVADNRWRRVETGAAPPRAGSYFLIESEVEGLNRLVHRLNESSADLDPLEFAQTRFRYGCERDRPLEALSDHLLAVRSALGGEGVFDAPLAARAAALVTGEADDLRSRGRFELAMDLEQTLINGEAVMSIGGESATYISAWIEDSTRHIMREAVLGNFGSNLNVTAEETLLNTGLAAGEGSPAKFGSSAEWDVIADPEEQSATGEIPAELAADEPAGAEIHVFRPRVVGGTENVDPEVEAGVDPLFGSVPEFDPEPLPEIPGILEDSRFVAMPEIEAALGIEPGSERSTIDTGEKPVVDDAARTPADGSSPGGNTVKSSGIERPAFDRSSFEVEPVDLGIEPPDFEVEPLVEPAPAEGEIKVSARTEIGATLREDWLDSTGADETMEFPVTALGRFDQDRREADRGPRNRKLFPDPGTTEWSVSELRYRRRP